MTDPARTDSEGAARARSILLQAGGRFRDLLAPADAPALRRHGRMLFPDVSAIACSHNPYAWSEYIDPKAGAVRLVLGLGTRFGRPDEDYSRLMALSAPERRPEADAEEIARYAQRRVDGLDAGTRRPASVYFFDVVKDLSDLPLDLVAPATGPTHPVTGERTRVITFDGLIARTEFVRDVSGMLRVLRDALGHEVEVEFTATLGPDGPYAFHRIDARPLPGPGADRVGDKDLILKARGAVIGLGRSVEIDRIVYVSPAAYGQLPPQKRYDVARLIGRINRAVAGNVLLIGPGRWGTTSPELGIPVSFAEINRVRVLVEVAAMHGTLVPEVSLGTHFLNDLVARDILYLAVAPGRDQDAFSPEILESAPDRLAEAVPGEDARPNAVRLIDARDIAGGRAVRLDADSLRREVTCGLVPGV